MSKPDPDQLRVARRLGEVCYAAVSTGIPVAMLVDGVVWWCDAEERKQAAQLLREIAKEIER